MAIISVCSVTKDYVLGKTIVPALKGVSFEVEAGDFISVVGPSGCGKTTLLNILGLIDEPSQGSVRYGATDVASLADARLAEMRLRRVGFIFQSFNLIPVLTVFENIELPLIMDHIKRPERRPRVERLIELVGLTPYAKHRPDELSGGQRQRVAIARALVNAPEVVIADEPTANLDTVTGEAVLREMEHLNRERQVTFIFSTHNPEVMRYAKKIIRLRDGAVTGIETAGGAA